MKTYLIKFSSLICIGMLMWSCSQDPWTREQRTAFLDSCEDEGGTPGYCDCFMDQAMEKYPNYDDALGMSFEEAVELSLDCE